MDFKMVHTDNIIMTDNPEGELLKIATDVVCELNHKGMKIAVAESCTGGLVAKTITDVPGASNVFECGVVSYSNGIKTKLLHVPKDFLKSEGPINAETSVLMAKGVRETGAADVGIGITGVAGPGPDGDHNEGEIYIGLSVEDKSYVIALNTKTNNKREFNRQLAALNALNLVLTYLRNEMKEG